MRLSNWRQATFVPARGRAGLGDRFLGYASITTTLDLYGHLYPGEMDRYADRLDDAATDDDAAKMRPDDDTDEDDEK
jgi:hypothetical protein